MQIMKIADIEWIVLKEIGDKTLLFSKNVPYTGYFDQYSNEYENSELEIFLNGIFSDKLTESGFEYTKIANGIWPLTRGQYQLYAKELAPVSSAWLLRTPGTKEYLIQAVDASGNITEISVSESCGIRPAFMVDTKYLHNFLLEQDKLQKQKEEDDKREQERLLKERIESEKKSQSEAEEKKRMEEQARKEQEEKELQYKRAEELAKKEQENLLKEKEKIKREKAKVEELLAEQRRIEHEKELKIKQEEEERKIAEQRRLEREAQLSKIELDIDAFRMDDLLSEINFNDEPVANPKKKKKKKKKKKSNSPSLDNSMPNSNPGPNPNTNTTLNDKIKPMQTEEPIVNDPVLVDEIDVDYNPDNVSVGPQKKITDEINNSILENNAVGTVDTEDVVSKETNVTNNANSVSDFNFSVIPSVIKNSLQSLPTTKPTQETPPSRQEFPKEKELNSENISEKISQKTEKQQEKTSQEKASVPNEENISSTTITASEDETIDDVLLAAADDIDSSGNQNALPEEPENVTESAMPNDERIIIADAADEAEIYDIPIEPNVDLPTNMSKSLIRYYIKEKKTDREIFTATLDSNISPENIMENCAFSQHIGAEFKQGNIEDPDNICDILENEDFVAGHEYVCDCSVENHDIESEFSSECLDGACAVKNIQFISNVPQKGHLVSNIQDINLNDNAIENEVIYPTEIEIEIKSNTALSNKVDSNLGTFDDEIKEVVFVDIKTIIEMITDVILKNTECDMPINMNESIFVPREFRKPSLPQNVEKENRKLGSIDFNSEFNPRKQPVVHHEANIEAMLNTELKQELEHPESIIVEEKIEEKREEKKVVSPPISSKKTWTCYCGAENSGKFCSECGRKHGECKKNDEPDDEEIKVTEKLISHSDHKEKRSVTGDIVSPKPSAESSLPPNIPQEIKKDVRRRDNSTYKENNKIIRRGQNFILNYLGVSEEEKPSDKPSMADIVNAYANKK